MNKDELLASLRELDAELAAAFPGGQPIECLVVGGACLVLAGITTRATTDIDVCIFNLMGAGEASLVYNLTPLTRRMRSIIKKVGKKCGLTGKEQMFFNDDCEIFLAEVSDIPPPMRLLLKLSKLHLYIPEDMRFILACKLMAGRPEKDYSDIQALCELLHVYSRAQAQQILNRYVPHLYHQLVHDAPKTLALLFPS